jgi:DNA-binding NarL/FixJ family response regulator
MTEQCIFLIDDHSMFRTGIRMVLQSALPGITVREAASLEQAVRPPSAAPDLALLDIALEGVNGLEGIGLLRQRWPTTPIIMLSSSAEPETVRLALARGAAAFISKADTAVHIVEVVSRVLAGTLEAGGTELGEVAAATLTPRQCEVLELLAQGLANKAIARRMQLSEFTVRGHVHAVLRILGVTSRSQAANAARARGLLR